MPSRGFIALPIWGYAALGTAVVVLGLGVAVRVQTARLDACKAEYAAFVAQAKALGEAAEKAAKVQEATDRKRKEAADAENARTKRDLAALHDAYRSLRDQRARSGYVPAATAGSASPDRACFDRAELERTMGRIDAGGAGIAEEGDKAIGDLNTARQWAR